MHRKADTYSLKLTTKQARLAKEQKWRARIIATMGILTFIGIILCGYGHAAVSTDLLISGDATISAPGASFTSQYMQDMTATECADAAPYTTSKMIDKRDGKSYWVTKFNDGRCWMTQNLALELSRSNPLTPELSDVSSNWIPEADTYNSITTTTRPAKINGTRSWYFKDETGGPYVSVGVNPGACAPKQSSLEGCVDVSVIKAAGRKPSDNPNFWNKNGQDLAYNDTEYDTHFEAGAYYQFNAATAGTGYAMASNQDAPSSICPKNWGLPSKDDTLNFNTAESSLILTVTDGAPYYFAQLGRIYSGINQLWQVGNGISYHWTKTIQSKGNQVYYIDGQPDRWLASAGGMLVVNNVRCVFYGEEE